MFLVFMASVASGETEPHEAGCKAKEAAACVELGGVHAQAQDTRAARNAYEKACKLGAPEGCGLAGEIAAEEQDDEGALALFETGCTGGDVASCGGRARMSFDANNNEAAIGWGTKGCVSEPDIAPCAQSASCKVAAPKACRTVYAAAGELRRFDVAYTSALTACRLADSQMCTLAYNDTPYVTVEQRMEVLRLGCEEGGDPAMCHEYGVQLSVGDLLPKDEATGRTYSVRACDAGSVDACNSLAETLLADRRTEAEALPFLEKACTAGSTRSCARAKSLQGSEAPR